MIRLSPVTLSLSVVAALSLAGCDSAPVPEAQPEGAAPAASAPAPPPLPGRIVRFKAGESIPAISVTDPGGNTLELAKVGKPVLLNLWATWCAPCKVEMPLLDSLASELAGEVRVLTVSQDIQGAEKVAPFFEAEGFANLEPWLDPETELGVQLADGGLLPTTILYDAQGIEVFRVAGDYEWDSEEAIAQIREALDLSAS
ncbi:MAG: TlpA disulfide reductase family protein [Pseudomonadota bacterium]